MIFDEETAWEQVLARDAQRRVFLRRDDDRNILPGVVSEPQAIAQQCGVLYEYGRCAGCGISRLHALQA